jgi:hypothetical protein
MSSNSSLTEFEFKDLLLEIRGGDSEFTKSCFIFAAALILSYLTQTEGFSLFQQHANFVISVANYSVGQYQFPKNILYPNTANGIRLLSARDSMTNNGGSSRPIHSGS